MAADDGRRGGRPKRSIEVELELERTAVAVEVREAALLERIEALALLRLGVQRVLAVVVLLPFFCKKQQPQHSYSFPSLSG